MGMGLFLAVPRLCGWAGRGSQSRECCTGGARVLVLVVELCVSLKSMSVEKIYICSWNAHKFLCLESDFFVVITEKIGVGSCFLMVGWFGIESDKA